MLCVDFASALLQHRCMSNSAECKLCFFGAPKQAVGGCEALAVLQLFNMAGVSRGSLSSLTQLRRLAALCLTLSDCNPMRPCEVDDASVAALLPGMPHVRYVDWVSFLDTLAHFLRNALSAAIQATKCSCDVKGMLSQIPAGNSAVANASSCFCTAAQTQRAARLSDLPATGTAWTAARPLAPRRRLWAVAI